MNKPMNKIKDKIKAFFACTYRLAVWTAKGRLYNFTADNLDEVVAQAVEICGDLNKATWTLYKSGRWFLPEREIERSTDNLKH